MITNLHLNISNEHDYIVHLVGRVVAVSVATRTIVGGLEAVF